jgi:ankyrin repeat protein
MNLQFIEYDADKKTSRVKIDTTPIVTDQLEGFLSRINISYEKDAPTHVYTFKDCTAEDFLQKTQEYFLTKGDVTQENWQEFTRKMTHKTNGLRNTTKDILNYKINQNLGLKDQLAIQRGLRKKIEPNYVELFKSHFPDYYYVMLKERERANLILNVERKPGETTQLPPIDYKLLYQNAYAKSYATCTDDEIQMMTQFKEGNLDEIKKIYFVVMRAGYDVGSYEARPFFANNLFEKLDSEGRNILAWAHINNRQAVLGYIYEEAKKVETGLDLIKWAIRCHQSIEVIEGIPYEFKGVEVDTIASFMQTAAGWGHVDVVKYMLNLLPVTNLKNNMILILERAIKFGHLNIVKYLVEERGMDLREANILYFFSKLKKNIENDRLHNIAIQDYIFQWIKDNNVDITGYLRAALIYEDDSANASGILVYKSNIEYSLALDINLNAITTGTPKTLLGLAVRLDNLELIRYICAIYKNKNDPASFSLAVQEALQGNINDDLMVYLLYLAHELSVDLGQPYFVDRRFTILDHIIKCISSAEAAKVLTEMYADHQSELNKIIKKIFKLPNSPDAKVYLLLNQVMDPNLINIDLYLKQTVKLVCSTNKAETHIKALCHKYRYQPEELKIIVDEAWHSRNIEACHYLIVNQIVSSEVANNYLQGKAILSPQSNAELAMSTLCNSYADHPESLKLIINTAFESSHDVKVLEYLLTKQTVDSALIYKRLENMGYAKTITALLLSGVDPDFITTSGLPYLASSISKIKYGHCLYGHRSIIEGIIAGKANVNATFTMPSSLISDTVKKLAKKKNAKAAVDTAGIPGFTALHLAAMNNHPAIVDVLLKNGADMRLKALDITPLEIAFAVNNVWLICSLLNKQNSADLVPFLKNEFLLLSVNKAQEENCNSAKNLISLCQLYKLDANDIIRQVLVILSSEPDPQRMITLASSLLPDNSNELGIAILKAPEQEQYNIINSLTSDSKGQAILALPLFNPRGSSDRNDLKQQLFAHYYYVSKQLDSTNTDLLSEVINPIKDQVNTWVSATKDKKDDPLYPLAAYVESYATAWTNPRILFGQQKEPDMKRFLVIFMLIQQQKNHSPVLINSIDKLLAHSATATHLQKGSFREALADVKSRVQAVNSNTIANNS